MTLATLILAAGQGTRMKSTLAKVLHSVGGVPMVTRAVNTAWDLALQPPVVVVGQDAAAVQSALGDRAQYVFQRELRGTGHAVQQAKEALIGRSDLVIVYYADMPLLQAETLRRLVDAQTASNAAFTLLTATVPDPRGFGRVVRVDGVIREIVEERAASELQKHIRELNVGVYCFRADWLWEHIGQLAPNPQTDEIFITDLLMLAIAGGERVETVETFEFDEIIGVNTRVHLSEAEVALRRRICRKWQLAGVTISDPATTYIEERVQIGIDTLIEPNTHLRGETVIGTNCIIGPNSIIEDAKIGDCCTITGSVVESAILENDVQVGPFAHLRTGAYLERGVHIGNFGEVKNSRLGRDTRMGHFSYIGDAEIGADVNIGCGTITANFDGETKHKTVIGDGAFIGSDTILRAPVTVGANARTGAGAVVTHDVAAGQTVVGVPARPIVKKQE